MRRFLLILVSLALAIQLVGQNVDFYGTAIKKEVCNKFGFSNDAEVVESLNRICKAAGIPNNFALVSCPNINNCFAIYQDGIPYIVYDLNFIEHIKAFGFSNQTLPTATTNWQALTILAHELGHHLCQHTVNKALASRYTSAEIELQADEYAGYILARINATLGQAQAAMYHPNVSVKKTIQYPSRQERLSAIEKGYNRAKDITPSGRITKEGTFSPSMFRLAINEKNSFRTQNFTLSLDESKDFSLTFRVQSHKLGGSTRYGIAWNYVSNDEHMLFTLHSTSTNGYYSIGPGRTKIYTPFTRFSEGRVAINAEKGPDELQFKKQGTILIFLVNGTEVWRTDQYEIASNQFAFWVADFSDASALDWSFKQ